MATLNIYLNELSAMRRIEYADEKKAWKSYLDCLRLLSSLKGMEYKIWYSTTFYTQILLDNNDTVSRSLSRYKDLKKLFQLCLNSAKKWESGPLTDFSATYTYLTINVSRSSISEAYESSNIESTILQNFILSIYTDPQISVAKDKEKCVIPSFSDKEKFYSFLLGKGWIRKQYDLNSRYTPRDEQTILADSTLFTPTHHRCSGRRVYSRIGYDEEWYVDNLHKGQSAHIEVFDSVTKKQLGVSKIDRIDIYRGPTKEEQNRTLKYDI